MKRYETNVEGNCRRVADLLHEAASALNRGDALKLRIALWHGLRLATRDRVIREVIGSAMVQCRRSLAKQPIPAQREIKLSLRRTRDDEQARPHRHICRPWDWAELAHNASSSGHDDSDDLSPAEREEIDEYLQYADEYYDPSVDEVLDKLADSSPCLRSTQAQDDGWNLFISIDMYATDGSRPPQPDPRDQAGTEVHHEKE